MPARVFEWGEAGCMTNKHGHLHQLELCAAISVCCFLTLISFLTALTDSRQRLSAACA